MEGMVYSSIILNDVHKRYGNVYALKGVNLEVSQGKIVGVVGPNGSGKTTMFRLIGGIIKPDKGRIIVKGIDVSSSPERVKLITGYTPEFPSLYDELTVYENLEFFAKAYKLPIAKRRQRITELIELLEMSSFKDFKFSKLSKGQKQRVNIASALIHDPDILLLDEPTSGLDPSSAYIIREFIIKQADGGKTVLLSSHNLYEIERICNEIIMIFNGIVVAKGDIENFKRDNVIEIGFLKPITLSPEFKYSDVEVIEVKQDKLVLKVKDTNRLNAVLNDLIQQGVPIAYVFPRKSLENVYLGYAEKSG